MSSLLAGAQDGDSWRPSRTPSWRRGLRTLRRALVTLLAVGLLWLFFRAVFEPWSHVAVRLVALTGTDYDGFQVPPLAFQTEDLDALAPLAKTLHGGSEDWRIPALLSPQAMARLVGNLDQVTANNDNVLIVYTVAHGISAGGSGYLLCGNFDASRPADGRIAVRELIAALGRAPGHTKLLILDCGRFTFDPRLGVLVNDFPDVLAREVAAADNPNLWVLVATSPGERSHVSAASQRSVFGFFVEHGFRGAADLDGDGAIGLGELHRFVSKAVADCVRNVTFGAETQTPMLLAGSARPAGKRLPIIAPAVRSAPPPEPAAGSTADAPMAVDFRELAASADWNDMPDPIRQLSPTILASRLRQALPLPEFAAGIPIRLPTPKAAAPAASAPGGKPAGDKAAGDKAAKDQPGASESSDVADPKAAAELAESIVAAWRLRDELNGLPEPQARPVDFAPHRWRALQARLLGLEQETLAGKSAKPRAINRRLEKVVDSLKLPDIGDAADDILLPSSRGKPLPIQQSVRPRSLALAAAMAAASGKPLPADLQTAVQMLNAALTTTPGDKFWKWVETLTAEHDAFFELQWARRLRTMSVVSPELRDQTLQVCWLGERVAASAVGALPWVQPTIDAADRWRLTAERDLLDPGRLRDDRHVSNSLRQASELYRQAAHRLLVASTALRLEHDLIDRAADYVEWYNLAPVGSSAPVPAIATIEALLAELGDLIREFAQPQPASLAHIEQISNRLANLREKIESDLRPAFVASLLAPPGPVPWNAGLLLATPLPPLAARLRLLASVDRLDRPLELARQHGTLDAATSVEDPVGEQTWSALRRRADLQLRLARLAMIDCPHGQRPIENLEARYRAVADAQLSKSGNTSVRLERWQDLGAAFEDFYAVLPDLIQSSLANSSLNSAQRELTLKHWRWADLASRLIDARDVVRVKDLLPAERLERARFDAQLAWQRTRLLAFAAEATAAQAKHLSEAAGEYFTALAADGYDVPHGDTAQPVDLRTPAQIDLRRTDRHDARLTVQAGDRATDVWLVVEYDPQLIGTRSSVDRPFYVADRSGADASPLDRSAAPRVRPLALSATQSAGAPGTAGDGVASPAARLFDLAPSVKLAAGASAELKLVIDRKSPNRVPASLIVSAWTLDTVTRQAIEVSLPKPAPARLSVDAQAGCWAESGHSLKLYPFPNRVTPYRFLISRAGQPTEKVSAELRLLTARPAIAIPDTALESDEAADVLDRLSSGRVLGILAELPLPADGQSVPLAFEEAPPPKPPAPPPGAAPPAEAGPPSLASGLLVVVTDLASKRKMIRWIELMPQRPRRYIDPHADYDLAEERVRLRVRPQEGVSLPPDGSQIRWQLSGVNEGSIPGPAGEITREAPERVLSTRLAPQPNPVTLFVDVDGYPRSFAFRIESDATALSLPKADLVAIKLTSPASATAYRLPSPPIAVRLQADVPSDDLSGSEDFIEVGIDANRDRLLVDEPTVRLTADRQTSVTLEKLQPGGTLEVRTAVQDLSVEIPTTAVASGRVALLGRVCLAGKSVWSNSVELILDGEPPEIDRVTLKPGAKLVRGEKLDVLATATDGDLSGVAKVEVAFDAENLGHFGEEPKPLPATVDATGRWAAQLPTDKLSVGGYQLLLRATDRVGNVSEYKAVTVRIIAAEDAEKPLNKVNGTVTYGKQPIAEIQITLTPEKGEKLPPVASDERGNFTIPAVPPGNYTLSAAGVVRNKKRKAEAKVEVGPPPGRPKSVTLELK